VPFSLARLFRRDPHEPAAVALYARLVARARASVFYASLGVPDTLDGRFELVALHAFLVMHRLKSAESAARDLAQSLFDAMFADFDRSLRELGTGDLSVGREVRRMAEAFYGRAAAYERGLAGDAALGEALARNLYGTTTATPASLAAMARYVESALATLRQATTAALLAGRVDFGPLPVAEPAPAGPPETTAAP
jgi:cytochrome b pre-mRNA-processing protein 3